MISRAIKTIFIFIISIELVIAIPAANQSQIEAQEAYQEKILNKFNNESMKLRSKIFGNEEYEACVEMNKISQMADQYSNEGEPGNDKKERSIQEIIGTIETKACSIDTYKDVTNEKKEDPLEKGCPKKDLSGLIVSVRNKIKALKEDDQIEESLALKEKVFKEIFQEALSFNLQTRKIILDRNISDIKKLEVAYGYARNVMLPVRSFHTVLRSFAEEDPLDNYKLSELFLMIPASVITPPEEDEDSSVEDYIATLENGAFGEIYPFSMKVKQLESKNYLMTYRESNFDTGNFNPALSTMADIDMKMITKDPTMTNYIRALKTMTVKNMLTQLYHYKGLAVSKQAEETLFRFKMPQSCSSKLNGTWPEDMEFKYYPSQGIQFVSTIIDTNKLVTPQEESALYEDYFLKYANSDPLKNNYTRKTYFEDIVNARRGTNLFSYQKYKNVFDDVSHYDKVMGFMNAQLKELFLDRNFTLFGLFDEEVHEYPGKELIKKLTSRIDKNISYKVPTSRIDKDGTPIVKEIFPYHFNASPIIGELMLQQNARSWQELLAKETIDELKRNKVIIPMPELFGNLQLRHWALRNLSEYILSKEKVEKGSDFEDAFEKICDKSAWNIKNVNTNNGRADLFIGSQKFCSKDNTQHSPKGKLDLKKLQDYLRKFNVTDEYLPLAQFIENDKSIVNYYPFFQYIWEGLSKIDPDFKIARMSEYDFLVDQMEKIKNPWAMVRVGYLAARDRFNNISPLLKDSEREYECGCENKEIYQEKLEEIAKVLKVDRPITLGHGNKVLSKDAKKYIWEEIIQEGEKSSEGLFGTRMQKDKKYDFFELFNKVSYTTILSKDDLKKVLENLPFLISEEALNELISYFDSFEGKKLELYKRIYALRGNFQKQKNILAKFAKKYPEIIKSTEPTNAKILFLRAEEKIKSILYTDFIYQAAHSRYEQVYEQLGEFCDMGVGHQDQLRAIFHSSIAGQNDLNKLMGLPSVPEDILKKIDGWSSDDTIDFILGMGQLVTAIGAMISAGIINGATAGAATPASISLIGFGTATIGMQTALYFRERERLQRAEYSVKKVKGMQSINMAKKDAHDTVSHTKFWLYLEAVSIFPLLGLFKHSLNVGSRTLYNIGKGALKKQILKNDDIYRMDRIGDSVGILGLNKFGINKLLAIDVEKFLLNAKEDIRSLLIRLKNQKISKDEFQRAYNAIYEKAKKLAQKVKSQSKDSEPSKRIIEQITEADRVEHTVKAVVDNVDNSKSKFLKIFDHYTNEERLQKSILKFKKHKQKSVAIEMKHTQAINENKYLLQAKYWLEKPFRAIKGLITNVRHKHLATNYDRIVALRERVYKLVEEGTDLNTIIRTELEELSNLFRLVPMRLKDMPYTVLLEGGFQFLLPNRVPLLTRFGRAMILRQIFNASLVVKEEILLLHAKNALGLSAAKIGIEGIGQMFEGLIAKSDQHLAKLKKGSEDYKAFVGQRSKFRNDFIKKLHKLRLVKGEPEEITFKGKKYKLSAKNLKRYIFSPQGEREKALGKAIVSDVETLNNILKNGELKGFYDEILMKISGDFTKEGNINEFNDFLNALKMLIYNPVDNAAHTEIM